MSQFSPELCKLESLNMVYIMSNERLYCGIETQGHGFYFSIFISIFLSFPIFHVNIKKFYVEVFSGTFKARML